MYISSLFVGGLFFSEFSCFSILSPIKRSLIFSAVVFLLFFVWELAFSFLINLSSFFFPDLSFFSSFFRLFSTDDFFLLLIIFFLGFVKSPLFSACFWGLPVFFFLCERYLFISVIFFGFAQRYRDTLFCFRVLGWVDWRWYIFHNSSAAFSWL